MKKIVILSVVVLAVILTSGCNLKDTFSKKSNSVKAISQEEAKEKIENFVAENLIAAGVDFSVEEVSEENGMYKMKIVVKANGQEQKVDSYVTKDGKLFFPSGAIDIDEMEKKAQEMKAATEEAKMVEQKEIPKNTKPEIELFVMSYCPFGTQVEKGIIPVLEKLGSKVKFELKFVSYTMHGDEEADENMREYCIQKNNPTKIVSYLKCFLKSSAGGVTAAESCMVSLGINKFTTDACIKSSNEKFAVKSGEVAFGTDKEANEKYGVQGSPTLVINGVTATSGRDSASLLKSICSAFENEPAECQAELSSVAPSSGFGEGAGSSSEAICE